MRFVGYAWALLLCVGFAQTAMGQPASPAPGGAPPAGRYQLVTPFLVDTATGCVWQVVQDEKTKRYTFVETNVENLHWTAGSGAQTLLAARIDTAKNIPEEQKRVLKESLERTGCGAFNVFPATAQPPTVEPSKESKPVAPVEPTKQKKDKK